MDHSDPSDVDQLIFVVLRIDAGLRLLAKQPHHYVPNGHFHRIANLLTCVQAEVTDWLDGHADRARDRSCAVRSVTDRRQRSDRRDAPVPETAV